MEINGVVVSPPPLQQSSTSIHYHPASNSKSEWEERPRLTQQQQGASIAAQSDGRSSDPRVPFFWVSLQESDAFPHTHGERNPQDKINNVFLAQALKAIFKGNNVFQISKSTSGHLSHIQSSRTRFIITLFFSDWGNGVHKAAAGDEEAGDEEAGDEEAGDEEAGDKCRQSLK